MDQIYLGQDSQVVDPPWHLTDPDLRYVIGRDVHGTWLTQILGTSLVEIPMALDWPRS